ncbi:hypothetical protein [Photorhabdus sp. SF281]|uniref:hypothetical protein n=1 Tax=Photorhabdus sp. SF281 TaxID=3459527 RepID=UPI004043A0E7
MYIEKLIKYPFPEWANVFTDVNKLIVEPYCICYQYNVTQNGYGPYGFLTDISQKIISNIFNELYFFDSTINSLKKRENINKDGIYFYGENSENEKIMSEVYNYSHIILKNKFREKKGLPPISLPLNPVLLELYKDNLYRSEKVNELIRRDCGFIISDFYMPESGKTLIVFKPELWDEIVLLFEKEKVLFVELDSFNLLKAW